MFHVRLLYVNINFIFNVEQRYVISVLVLEQYFEWHKMLKFESLFLYSLVQHNKKYMLPYTYGII